MAIHRHTPYSPGPDGAEVADEILKLSGSVDFPSDEVFPEGAESLKRGQLVEVTLRGYLTGINEQEKSAKDRDYTERTFSVKASAVTDMRVLQQPAPRVRRDGALPGQVQLGADVSANGSGSDSDGAEAVAKHAEELGQPAERTAGEIPSSEVVAVIGRTGEIIEAGSRWLHADGYSVTVAPLSDQTTDEDPSARTEITTKRDDTGEIVMARAVDFGMLLGRAEAVPPPEPDAPPPAEEPAATEPAEGEPSPAPAEATGEDTEFPDLSSGPAASADALEESLK